MSRCEFDDDDDAPTMMAVSPRTTMPLLAVPRPSTIPRDIADYASQFAQVEMLAQAAAHAHAGHFATPPPPAPTPIPPALALRTAHAPHPTGPRTGAVVMRTTDTARRHAPTVVIRGKQPSPSSAWASVALVTFVGVLAILSAMAATLSFKQTALVLAPLSTAPAAVTAAPLPPTTVAAPVALPAATVADEADAPASAAPVAPRVASAPMARPAAPGGVKIAFAISATTPEPKKVSDDKKLEAQLQALGEEQLKR